MDYKLYFQDIDFDDELKRFNHNVDKLKMYWTMVLQMFTSDPNLNVLFIGVEDDCFSIQCQSSPQSAMKFYDGVHIEDTISKLYPSLQLSKFSYILNENTRHILDNSTPSINTFHDDFKRMVEQKIKDGQWTTLDSSDFYEDGSDDWRE